MSELSGQDTLKRKLEQKRVRVNQRYKYYEMKNEMQDFRISTPPKLRSYKAMLGWCAKAVDSLADRIVFHGWRDDYFNIAELFDMNNPDIFFDSAVLSALISSCCFIYISEDATGFPRMQVIDGGNATGVLDPITGLLTEGYAVLQRDERDNPSVWAYFTAENTQICTAGSRSVEIYENKAGIPLLVPVIFRPDARRPFGHSRISRDCMSLVQSALRTVKRSEISAEFYSYPQKYVLGTDPNLTLDKWTATMSSMLNFSYDENENHPVVGQFSQASMEPHLTQLRMFASAFAGATGLTLDDLGFSTDNPTSAEAIRASHENLRLTARKAQRTFGSGFLNAGYLAACVRDNFRYQRSRFYMTKPIWEPIFAPDAAQLSGLGDAVMKLQQSFPEHFTEEKLYDLTGF